MSRDFPDFIDPWKAAEGHRVFHGTMPLKKMRRLSLLLASAEGEAGFEACFYFDPQSNAIINSVSRSRFDRAVPEKPCALY